MPYAPEVSGNMPTRNWLDPGRWGKAQKTAGFLAGEVSPPCWLLY